MRPHVTACSSLILVAPLVVTLTVSASSAPPDQEPSASADSPAPAFEVASVRRNTSSDQGASIRALPGGRATVTNNTLRNIIRNAYRLQNFQIAGGPDWINSDRWDILAKAEGDAPPDQLMLMLRTLLADRFKLVVHTETRTMPIYALVPARRDGRHGPNLRPAAVDCAALIAAARGRGMPFPPTPPGERPPCGIRNLRGVTTAGGTTMADFARSLSQFAGRSVVDKTGLSGAYDIDLNWMPDDLPPPGNGSPPPASTDAPSLFTALQEQLGLKLESQRGPIEVLVIDSAERPIED